jgi:hypothetical protein
MSKEAGEVMRSAAVWCGVEILRDFKTDGVFLSVDVALRL